MRRPSRSVKMLSVAIGLALLAPRQAMAYIDPGSGSFFLQMLLAGILGLSMTLKLFWQRIKTFFSGGKRTSEDETDAPRTEDEPTDS